MMKKYLSALHCLLVICFTHSLYAQAEDWQRTTIFIFGQTQAGQDMFVRGGLDQNQARLLMGLNCAADNKLCAMPIRHLNLSNATTTPWKQADKFLDWQGVEAGQPAAAQGSPADWTTNLWPAAWGAKKTVLIDGVGETPLNTWGSHYWMLDVEMDCSRTFNGWFELKSFISNGPGWESNVSQAGAPYKSANHFAKCGKINKFERGSNAALIKDFPPGEALAPVQFKSELNNLCLSTSVDTTQAGASIVQASCNSNRSFWKLGAC